MLLMSCLGATIIGALKNSELFSSYSQSKLILIDSSVLAKSEASTSSGVILIESDSIEVTMLPQITNSSSFRLVIDSWKWFKKRGLLIPKRISDSPSSLSNSRLPSSVKARSEIKSISSIRT